MSGVDHTDGAEGASGGSGGYPSPAASNSDEDLAEAVEEALSECGTTAAEASVARIAGTLFAWGVEVPPERVATMLDAKADGATQGGDT